MACTKVGVFWPAVKVCRLVSPIYKTNVSDMDQSQGGRRKESTHQLWDGEDPDQQSVTCHPSSSGAAGPRVHDDPPAPASYIHAAAPANHLRLPPLPTHLFRPVFPGRFGAHEGTGSDSAVLAWCPGSIRLLARYSMGRVASGERGRVYDETFCALRPDMMAVRPRRFPRRQA